MPNVQKAAAQAACPDPVGTPAYSPQPTTLEKCLQLRPWLLAKEDPALSSLDARGWCVTREAEHHPWEKHKKPQNHL